MNQFVHFYSILLHEYDFLKSMIIYRYPRTMRYISCPFPKDEIYYIKQ